MAKTDNLQDFLVDLADTIREKTGTTDKINPQDFSLEISNIGGGGKLRPKTLSFNGYPDTDINFSLIDYSLLTSLSYFLAYTNYEELEFRDIDAPLATSIDKMFGNMPNLKKLALININIPKANSTAQIIYGSKKLEQFLMQDCDLGSVDLYVSGGQNIGTPIASVSLNNVKCGSIILNYAFKNCTYLTDFVVTNSDIISRNMAGAFLGCRNLQLVNLSGVDLSAAPSAEQMFMNCDKLKTVTCGKFFGASCTTFKELFSNCEALEYFTFPNPTPVLTNMYNIFHRCKNIKTIDVTKLDTSNVTDADYAFSYCNNLTEIVGIGDINVSKMKLLPKFSECTALTTLDLHKWQPLAATGLSSLFYGCTKMTSLNLSGWNFPNATSTDSTFSMCGISSNGTFELNLDGWDFAGITSMSQTFYSCGAQSLTLKRSSADKRLTMSATIYGCNYLTTLDMSEFTLENVSMSSFLSNCPNIENLKLNIVESLNLIEQTKITHDSLMYIINNAKDLTGGTTQTLALGTANLPKLTDDEKAIIIAKNWTLA